MKTLAAAVLSAALVLAPMGAAEAKKKPRAIKATTTTAQTAGGVSESGYPLYVKNGTVLEERPGYDAVYYRPSQCAQGLILRPIPQLGGLYLVCW